MNFPKEDIVFSINESTALYINILFLSFQQVKFSSNPPNGDAKIDISDGQTFSGLNKEELMKYADDPFWVRLRWALFIIFWWVVAIHFRVISFTLEFFLFSITEHEVLLLLFTFRRKYTWSSSSLFVLPKTLDLMLG